MFLIKKNRKQGSEKLFKEKYSEKNQNSQKIVQRKVFKKN